MWRHCKKIGSRRKSVWIGFAFWSDSFWTLSRAVTWRTAPPWLSISASPWSGPENFEAYQISPRYAVTIAWAFASRKKFNFTVGDLETWTVLVSHVAACDIHAKSATSVYNKGHAIIFAKIVFGMLWSRSGVYKTCRVKHLQIWWEQNCDMCKATEMTAKCPTLLLLGMNYIKEKGWHSVLKPRLPDGLWHVFGDQSPIQSDIRAEPLHSLRISEPATVHQSNFDQELSEHRSLLWHWIQLLEATWGCCQRIGIMTKYDLLSNIRLRPLFKNHRF